MIRQIKLLKSQLKPDRPYMFNKHLDIVKDTNTADIKSIKQCYEKFKETGSVDDLPKSPRVSDWYSASYKGMHAKFTNVFGLTRNSITVFIIYYNKHMRICLSMKFFCTINFCNQGETLC